MNEIKEKVREQFQKTAAAYVTSQVHAKGADLEWLPEIAVVTGSESVLDVACGAGHTAFAFAPRVARVVGVDLASGMVKQATAGARERDLANVTFQVSDVDELPFPNGSFDVVTCRIAAHHFPHLAESMREMARVLRPGGRCLIVDNYVPEEPELDRFINAFEQRRDPSHVRAYSLSEWAEAFRQAGLTFAVARTFTTRHEFESWVKASQTPPEAVAWLREQMAGAAPAVQNHFGIQLEPVAAFQLHKAILVGVR